MKRYPLFIFTITLNVFVLTCFAMDKKIQKKSKKKELRELEKKSGKLIDYLGALESEKVKHLRMPSGLIVSIREDVIQEALLLKTTFELMDENKQDQSVDFSKQFSGFSQERDISEALFIKALRLCGVFAANAKYLPSELKKIDNKELVKLFDIVSWLDYSEMVSALAEEIVSRIQLEDFLRSGDENSVLSILLNSSYKGVVSDLSEAIVKRFKLYISLISPQSFFKGQDSSVERVIQLKNRDLLSWSDDKIFKIWDGTTGKFKKVSPRYKASIEGVVQLNDGSILCWFDDRTLKIVNQKTGKIEKILSGHADNIYGAVQMHNGSILSWSDDTTLKIWDRVGGKVKTLTSHTKEVNGALELQDGVIVSWSRDTTIKIWDSSDGTLKKTLLGYQDTIDGAITLKNGTLVSWSQDASLKIWNLTSGKVIKTLAGHTDRVVGALQLSDELHT